MDDTELIEAIAGMLAAGEGFDLATIDTGQANQFRARARRIIVAPPKRSWRNWLKRVADSARS